MAYALLATQCPLPTGDAVPPYQSACSSSLSSATGVPPYVPGASANLTLQQNKMLAWVAASMGYGGNGYGVVDGLQISSGSGLSLNVTQGHGAIMSMIEYGGGSVVLTDNQRNFVWLLQTGALQPTITTTPPSNDCVYIGNAVCAGGVITSVDYSGVVLIRDGIRIRFTGDAFEPGDSPNASYKLLTVTSGGTYLWDGTAHRWQPDLTKLKLNSSGVVIPNGHFQQSSNVQNLTGALALTNASQNVQHLTCASGQNVLLPANSTIGFGHSFTIYNDNPSGGANLTVLDSSGTVTLTTLNPGQFATYLPLNNAGNPVWPNVVAAQNQPTSGPSVIQITGGNNNVTGSTSYALPAFGAAPSQGNYVYLAFFGANGSVGITSITSTGITGWTKIASYYTQTNGAFTLELWRGTVGAGAGTTITVNTTASMPMNAYAMEVANTAGTVDQTANSTGTTTTSPVTGTTPTTTHGSEIWFGLIMNVGASSESFSAPTNGYTVARSGSFNTGGTQGSWFAYKIVSALGTAGSGATSSPTAPYAGLSVAVN